VIQTRYELACELTRQMLTVSPSGAFFDHLQYRDCCRIAEAIERGESLCDILSMAEAKRLPDASSWLKKKL